MHWVLCRLGSPDRRQSKSAALGVPYLRASWIKRVTRLPSTWVCGAPSVTMRLKLAALSSPACHAGLEGVCCDPQEKPLGSMGLLVSCDAVQVIQEDGS